MISNFGVGFLADRLEWRTLFGTFSALLAAAIILLLIITPRWRRFSKE